MKSFLIFFCLVALISVTFCDESQTTRRQRKNKRPLTSDDKKSFEQWRKNYRKQYKSFEEEQRALEIFVANKDEIDAHNEKFKRGEVTFKRGLFKYSDMTPEEKRKYLGGIKMQPQQRSLPATTEFIEADYPTGPDFVDWTDHGLVGPVHDQGWCGSCWAFSAAGATEAFFRKTRKDFILSPQQLVDCITFNSWGCQSGWPHIALNYIRDNGIAEWEEYPYKGYNQTCEFNKTMSVGTINKTNNVKMEGNETVLRDIVANVGPVAAVFCLSDEFYNYQSGIFSIDNCCNDIEHAVLITGYGTENGTDYWIIKNSWGESWGDKGYGKFRRNHNNMCNIGFQAVWAS